MDDYGMDDQHMDGVHGVEDAHAYPSADNPSTDNASPDNICEEVGPSTANSKHGKAECWKHFVTTEECVDGHTVVRARFREYYVAQQKKPRTFGVDIKTRWSSTYLMLREDDDDSIDDILILTDVDWDVATYEQAQHRQEEAEIECQMAEFRLGDDNQD
ncbi:hypothetical protein GUJ93_ZPchr0011g27805 [Zizania palustris]|uniref:Uncharacterized protein n=1 Tax=Zizania palustris TaxID=103762 RepID=A0A8J5WIA6_ZIZPA|nr:hypothetical protein GUJ93_ZPchr0011g27805 [Zizania palustris]